MFSTKKKKARVKVSTNLTIIQGNFKTLTFLLKAAAGNVKK